MYKELSICIVIIVSIVSLNIITRNYTKTSVKKMNENLENIKELTFENIEKENEEEKSENSNNLIEKEMSSNNSTKDINESFKNLENDWKNMYSKLTYYLEHDELEKVSTKIANIRANIQTGEGKECVSNIEECKFILEHISEKEQFKIQNIF